MFKFFYNERLRKSVAMFGALFDEIYIVKKGSSGSFQQMRVPFSYAPKRKFLERIAQMDRGEDNERQVAITLPRMSFEMTSVSYDAVRQLPKMNGVKRSLAGNSSLYGKYYVGVPYIVSFSLNIYAKSQDEALQIVEQILPYFNPQYTISMKPYDDVEDIVEDVPVYLASVSFTDDYENELAARRTIVYQLDFEMKINFWGPAPSDDDRDKLIRRVITNMYGLHDSDQFFGSVHVELDPFTASPDSDYTIITNIYDTDSA
jgi:hypothetical protein